jgi:hypothetical protein
MSIKRYGPASELVLSKSQIGSQRRGVTIVYDWMALMDQLRLVEEMRDRHVNVRLGV